MWGLTAKAGLPPTTLSGQAQTTKPTTFTFKTPNSQSTQTSGIESLIETGNKNILANPSFEHSTFSTSWTNSAGTFTQETSVLIDGKDSAKLVLAAQTMSLSQSSTLYAAQFADGVQGLAMVWIKSSVALNVCSIQAGTVSTTNCVITSTDSKWGLYKVPFILGGTSNGISIASSGNVTGTVYVDDCFVGAADLVQDAPLIGPATSWTPTVTGFGSTSGISFRYWQVGSKIIGEGTFTAGTATAVLGLVTIPTAFTIDSTSLGLANTSGNAGPIIGKYACTGTSNSGYLVAATGTSTSNIYFGNFNGAAGTNIPTNASSIATAGLCSLTFSIPVNELRGSTSTYSSQCGANCVDNFTAKVSPAGVVSAENSDFINGNCVVSDTSLYTCTFNTNLFTVSPNCTLTSGNTSTDSSSASIGNSVLPTTTTLVARGWDPAGSGVGTRLAQSFTINCQKQGADFVATRTIQGSFKNVVVTPTATKPAMYSFSLTGGGVVSKEFGDIVNGNCTNANPRVCTFNSVWASAPNCVVTSNDGSDTGTNAISISTSSLSVNTFNQAGTALSRDSMVVCHGEGL